LSHRGGLLREKGVTGVGDGVFGVEEKRYNVGDGGGRALLVSGGWVGERVLVSRGIGGKLPEGGRVNRTSLFYGWIRHMGVKRNH